MGGDTSEGSMDPPAAKPSPSSWASSLQRFWQRLYSRPAASRLRHPLPCVPSCPLFVSNRALHSIPPTICLFLFGSIHQDLDRYSILNLVFLLDHLLARGEEGSFTKRLD